MSDGIGRFAFSPGRSGPVVELLPDGVSCRICEPWVYVSSDGHHWAIPAGWESDGASIPQMFWSKVGSPMTGKYRNAALVHDYLYHSHPIDPATGVMLTKERADRLLLDAMYACGLEDHVLAETIYGAVRAAGFVAWAT
jgi:hypothetical protein